MPNAFNRLKSRLNRAEKKVCELKGRSIKITQTEPQGIKKQWVGKINKCELK